MARTESRMLALGTPAPHFSLPDAHGNTVELVKPGNANAEATPKAVLVMFICNHCPFVKHIRPELARLGRDYRPPDVLIYAINSNDAERHPDDSPAAMRAEIAEWGYEFPYLVDAGQSVARDYDAACTPDFYVFDGDLKLAYRGQLDGSRPGNDIPTDGRDLRAALDAVLRGKQPPEKQVPSVGCNIKWKPGNAPEWFK